MSESRSATGVGQPSSTTISSTGQSRWPIALSTAARSQSWRGCQTGMTRLTLLTRSAARAAIEVLLEAQELLAARPIGALEIQEGHELAHRCPGGRLASSLPTVAVDDGRLGKIDDLASGVADAKAPIGVVPTEEHTI